MHFIGLDLCFGACDVRRHLRSPRVVPVDAHSALRRLNKANMRMIENRVTRQSRPTFHGTSSPGNSACIADWLDKKKIPSSVIAGPSRPCHALPNGTRLFSTTVRDTAADETVLDTQSIPVPVVSVRHHHSFAQIIIRWNCVSGIKSLLRPTQKYLVHGAARGTDQALQKNAEC